MADIYFGVGFVRCCIEAPIMILLGAAKGILHYLKLHLIKGGGICFLIISSLGASGVLILRIILEEYIV